MLLKKQRDVNSDVKIVVLGGAQALVLLVARPLVKEDVNLLAKGLVPIHVLTYTTNENADY